MTLQKTKVFFKKKKAKLAFNMGKKKIKANWFLVFPNIPPNKKTHTHYWCLKYVDFFHSFLFAPRSVIEISYFFPFQK